MRNNKAILEEAARSVRRTFIGSIAGSVGMLAVVGAAGAYGMPEKFTAQAFNAALASLKLSSARHLAAKPVESIVVAENVTRRDVMPVSEPAPQTMPVVHAVPQLPTEPASRAPAAAPAPSIVATADAPPIASAEPAPVAPAAAEPTPVQTASIAPQALPENMDRRVAVPAPLVFETPKPDLIPAMTALPKLEPDAPAAVAEPARPATTAAPAAPAKPAEGSSPELPRTIAVLPPPKPPLSPAQRLDLHGKDYDKAEKCLAQAVYFEARNEPARGQQAVAQVVLNRVFSPYYPKDVCSVVYQNAQRHLSCQFTFACDGKPETIRERGAWARANRIAKQTLEAKVWLPEVAKATHYHAAYVHPRWVRDMRVMVRYGLHTFYRPRNWGDGSNEPSWGTAANSAKTAPVKAVSVKHPVPAPRAYRRIALRRASA